MSTELSFKDLLQQLSDKFREVSDSWDEIVNKYTKTNHTKAITLQDWNNVVALLGRTDAYVRGMFPVVEGFGELGDAYSKELKDIKDEAVEAASRVEDIKEIADNIRSKTVKNVELTEDFRLKFTFEDDSVLFTENVRGPQGVQGPQGSPFSIAKVYSTVVEMNNNFDTDGLPEGSFVIISTNDVNDPDNSKLFVKGKSAYQFINDLSGAVGIQGPQGIQGIQGVPGKDGVYTLSDADKNDIAARAIEPQKGVLGGIVPLPTKVDSGQTVVPTYDQPNGGMVYRYLSVNTPWPNNIPCYRKTGQLVTNNPIEDTSDSKYGLQVVNLQTLKKYLAASDLKVAYAKTLSNNYASKSTTKMYADTGLWLVAIQIDSAVVNSLVYCTADATHWGTVGGPPKGTHAFAIADHGYITAHSYIGDTVQSYSATIVAAFRLSS